MGTLLSAGKTIVDVKLDCDDVSNQVEDFRAHVDDHCRLRHTTDDSVTCCHIAIRRAEWLWGLDLS